MEDRIIKRIRISKRRLYKLYKIVKSEIDMDVEMLDSDSLLKMEIISKINEELTDIIYLVLNNKNS